MQLDFCSSHALTSLVNDNVIREADWPPQLAHQSVWIKIANFSWKLRWGQPRAHPLGTTVAGPNCKSLWQELAPRDWFLNFLFCKLAAKNDRLACASSHWQSMVGESQLFAVYLAYYMKKAANANSLSMTLLGKQSGSTVWPALWLATKCVC